MWMRKCDNAAVGEKLARYESLVRGCIVIMEKRTVRAPQFRLFLSNVLPQTAKNTAVELGIHGLAFGSKFMVHNPSNVKKHNEELVLKLFDTPTYISGFLSWTQRTLTLCHLMSYIYMSYRTANLQMLHFKYLFNNVRTEYLYFKHAA
jgi:hypothetical protein